MNWLGYLTATDLMNFVYCARIVFYVHVLKIPQVTTGKELAGRKKFDSFERESKRRLLVVELPHLRRAFRLHLVSDDHMIHTFADCILLDEDAKKGYPYQIKYGRRPRVPYRGQRLQVWMEALLVESQLHYEVPRAYIKYIPSDDLVEVDVTSKDAVLSEFQRIRRILKNEQCPAPTPYKRRCVDCCYNTLCWGDVK